METEKKEVIFKIKNLKTWFPITKGFMKKVVGNVKAVDDVSIEVYKGETLGIRQAARFYLTITVSIKTLQNSTKMKCLSSEKKYRWFSRTRIQH